MHTLIVAIPFAVVGILVWGAFWDWLDGGRW